MDSTLQKRLIGAAVLIVLAIIFVPMLLDGSSRGGTETMPLVIPGMPERDFETRDIAIDPAQATGVADAIGVVTPPQTDVAVAPAPATDPDALATVDTLAPTRVDAVSGEAVQAPVVTEPATAPSAPMNTSMPTPATAPIPSDTAPVAAAVATTASTAPATTASGRFLLALGSYSNTANAQALATQLRGAGYKVLSDQVAVNGQNATRLRVGPYASRGQAEAARLAIKGLRADLSPSISEVDDAPTVDAPVTALSAATASVWAVQVGAFKVETEATAKRDQLRQAGFAAFVEKINAEAGVLFRVRIGPENKRADADAVKAGIKTRFGIDGIVVPYP